MTTRLAALMLTATFVLSGCAATQLTDSEKELVESMGAEQFQPATRVMRDNIETQPLLSQATFWQREYELNPGDLESAIKLASTVRRMGNPERAIEITQTTRALYPKDPYLVAEYAAGLVAAERGATALPVLETALRTTPGYARLWSLRGAALDQAERYDDARKSYQRALAITPYDPNVLANMGLSFALEGDAVTAEQWLTKAASIPGASENVTRNLDLVRQLQGKSVDARPAPTRQTSVGQTSARPASARQAVQAPAQAAVQPSGSFRVFNESEARTAADAARMMARTSSAPVSRAATGTSAGMPKAPASRPAPNVLRAEDPDALKRLARNARPAARAVQRSPRMTRRASQGQVPHQGQPQGQGQPQIQRQPQGQGQPQIQRPPQGLVPQQARSPFAPKGQGPVQTRPAYAPQAPQGYSQAPVVPPQGYPAAYPQGAAPYPQGAGPYPHGAPARAQAFPQQPAQQTSGRALPRGRARGR